MIHIKKFIDSIKVFESKRSKNYTMTLVEAKNLHNDITKLLIDLQEANDIKEDDTITEVIMSGNSW